MVGARLPPRADARGGHEGPFKETVTLVTEGGEGGGQRAVTRVPGEVPAEAERGRSRSRSNKADKKLGLSWKAHNISPKLTKFSRRCHFSKI